MVLNTGGILRRSKKKITEKMLGAISGGNLEGPPGNVLINTCIGLHEGFTGNTRQITVFFDEFLNKYQGNFQEKANVEIYGATLVVTFTEIATEIPDGLPEELPGGTLKRIQGQKGMLKV